jgi:hypothetical protein
MGTSGCMLIAVAALSAACLASPWAGEVVAAEPASARAAGAVGAPIAWCACGPPEGLECARVRVPLDWTARTGARSGSRLVHYLASKAEQRIGSTLNPGGPGDTGVGLVRGRPDARVAMLQRLRDLRPESVGHRLSQDMGRARRGWTQYAAGRPRARFFRRDRGLAERPSLAGALAP